MEFSAKKIAEYLNGSVEGNKNTKVSNVSSINDATPGSLTFLANPAYAQFLYTTKASIVLINKDFKIEKPVNCTLIRVDDAYNSLAKILELYNKYLPEKKGVSKLAYISKSAKIGKNTYIGEFAYVGENTIIGDNVKIHPQSYIDYNVKIGDNTKIYPGTKIFDRSVIGKDCIIHAGAVIGSDGFGFAREADKNFKKIAQIGNVVIEDNVEIGANTTIDRATFGSTIIKKGTKLDNLIMIAHNVVIDKNTVIAAQSGISGSSKVGKNCMIGGQVGISGHLNIEDNVKIAAQAGIGSNIKKDKTIMGSPAIDASNYKKSYVHFKNFQRIINKIEELESEINTLKKKKKK